MENQQEIWKDIIGYEGMYQVSNLGRIKSVPRKMLLRGKYPYISKEYIMIGGYWNGYHIIGLKKENLAPKKSFIAHRIVAQAFIPNPENKPHVNHINGIKSDNRVENLEWCTQSENIKHTYANKLMTGKSGENNYHSKLKDADIIEIRASKLKQKDLAVIYGISRPTVCDIIKRRTWNHL